MNNNIFEPIHCQKDYFDNTIILQYEGEFNKEQAFEYIKRSYPSFLGEKIIANEPPNDYNGYKNMGMCIVI